ncbi:MAG TPA: hypothetical protein VGE64_04075 [Xanthomonadaceae bacterium]
MSVQSFAEAAVPMIPFVRHTLAGLLLGLCCAIAMPACAATLGKADADVLRRDIDAMMAAYEQGDVEALLGKTHPSLFKLVGDRDAFSRTAQQALDQLEAQGVRFVSSETGDPSDTYPAGDEEVCFVPRKSILEVQGRRMKSSTFMIAIRPVGGGEWTYLDGSGMRGNPQMLYTLLPALSRDVPLPPISFDAVEE